MMMELSSAQIADIKSKLPKVCFIQRKLLLPIDLLAARLGPKSTVDVSLVNLRDASEVACEVEYALYEALSYYIQLKEIDEQDRNLFVQRSKFYVDDAALRLYAAAEHVANFIQNFLSIESSKLEPYKKDNRTSFASIVGNYLISEMPSLEITKVIKELAKEPNWQKTIYYRNRWVHEQPPLLKEMGIAYKRKSRWQKTHDGNYALGIGLGESADYTLDELIEMVLSAYSGFAVLLEKMTNIALDFLKDKNIYDGKAVNLLQQKAG
jgi:hypothetical protein